MLNYACTRKKNVVLSVFRQSRGMKSRWRQWRSWCGCLCGVCIRKRVRGNFSFSSPKQWRFCKISRARKTTKQKNRCRMKDWSYFLKSCVLGGRIDEAQNERQLLVWVNEKCLDVVCGLGVFQETLAKRSFDTFAREHGELRCGQASTLTP